MASLQKAALDPVHWPSAAGLIDRAIGVNGNALLISSGTDRVCERISFWRVCFGGRRCEDLEREYFRDYWSRDERVPRVNRLRDGELVSTGDLYTADEKEISPAYELIRQADMHTGLHVRLGGMDGLQVAWALGECNDTRGWSSAQVAAIEQLLPHGSVGTSAAQVVPFPRVVHQIEQSRWGVVVIFVELPRSLPDHARRSVAA